MARGIKTGGRKKGTPNKSTVAAQRQAAQAAESGITPLEFALTLVRDTGLALDTRLKAAIAAMPFCHQALARAEVQHSGEVKLDHEVVITFD